MNRSFASKKEIIIIFILFAAALAAWTAHTLFFSGEGASAEILYNGEVIMTVPLSKDEVFSAPGHPHVIFHVQDGACAFIVSDCPDKVCIHEGYLSTPGQTAACLPNRMVLRIAGEGEEQLDAVAR